MGVGSGVPLIFMMRGRKRVAVSRTSVDAATGERVTRTSLRDNDLIA